MQRGSNRARTRTHYEITLCITQLICSSRLQKTYYALIGQWADGEAMERLWSWNVHCLDLQRWRETITFVWTVSIATFSLSLPVFLSIPSYLFIYLFIGNWRVAGNQSAFHPLISADTFFASMMHGARQRAHSWSAHLKLWRREWRRMCVRWIQISNKRVRSHCVLKLAKRRGHVEMKAEAETVKSIFLFQQFSSLSLMLTHTVIFPLSVIRAQQKQASTPGLWVECNAGIVRFCSYTDSAVSLWLVVQVDCTISTGFKSMKEKCWKCKSFQPFFLFAKSQKLLLFKVTGVSKLWRRCFTLISSE